MADMASHLVARVVSFQNQMLSHMQLLLTMPSSEPESGPKRWLRSRRKFFGVAGDIYTCASLNSVRGLHCHLPSPAQGVRSHVSHSPNVCALIGFL